MGGGWEGAVDPPPPFHGTGHMTRWGGSSNGSLQPTRPRRGFDGRVFLVFPTAAEARAVAANTLVLRVNGKRVAAGMAGVPALRGLPPDGFYCIVQQVKL